VGVAVVAALLGACGGGGDDAATSTSSSTVAQTAAPVTPAPVTDAPTTSAAPAPTTIAYVTEGASVIVANASRVDGGAGRLSDRLASVGYTTVTPDNYTLGQLDVSKIYYDPTNPAAQGVAEGLKAAFGGGAIEVLEMPSVPPAGSGDLGGAGVLVAMGNDIADKSLDELQGVVTTTTTTAAPDTLAVDTGAPDTTG
jgi:hypothetical protein